jgi:hypothetical protein
MVQDNKIKMEKRIKLGKSIEREGAVQIKVIFIEICGLFAPFRWP